MSAMRTDLRTNTLLPSTGITNTMQLRFIDLCYWCTIQVHPAGFTSWKLGSSYQLKFSNPQGSSFCAFVLTADEPFLLGHGMLCIQLLQLYCPVIWCTVTRLLPQMILSSITALSHQTVIAALRITSDSLSWGQMLTVCWASTFHCTPSI